MELRQDVFEVKYGKVKNFPQIAYSNMWAKLNVFKQLDEWNTQIQGDWTVIFNHYPDGGFEHIDVVVFERIEDKNLIELLYP